MVEATTAGDGIHRPVQYASFRTDKPAAKGYSAELISDRVDPRYYDNLDAMPGVHPECDTMLKFFKRNVATRANEPFLGTRQQLANDANGKPVFGDYEWKTFGEVDVIAQKLARGVMALNLCPQIEGEGQLWRFLGIWAKNRWEWTTTLLACMHYKITAVGFYDAMSSEQVDFILA